MKQTVPPSIQQWHRGKAFRQRVLDRANPSWPPVSTPEPHLLGTPSTGFNRTCFEQLEPSYGIPKGGIGARDPDPQNSFPRVAALTLHAFISGTLGRNVTRSQPAPNLIPLEHSSETPSLPQCRTAGGLGCSIEAVLKPRRGRGEGDPERTAHHHLLKVEACYLSDIL